MKIAFIGGGAMAEAMIKVILGKGLATPQDIIASDVSQERLFLLNQAFSVRTVTDNRQAIEGSEVVVLAIKPQNLIKDSRDIALNLYGCQWGAVQGVEITGSRYGIYVNGIEGEKAAHLELFGNIVHDSG